jgi:hypothetical protein
MPTTTVLSRVRTDFFAILVPGSFVLIILASISLAFTHRDPAEGIIQRVKPFFDVLKNYWPLVLILLIIAYLAGNIIRAVRVNLADMLSKKLFANLAKREWLKVGYESAFPYPAVLEKMKNELIESKLLADFSLPEEKNLHNVYNYWKMVICLESQEVFTRIRNAESVVRLFVGMFWAGFIGVLGYLIILAGCLFNVIIRYVWLEYAIVMLAISIVILVTFGMNIRRVRAQEVGFVFMGYLVIKQKQEQEEKITRQKKKSQDFNQTLGSLFGMMGKKE